MTKTLHEKLKQLSSPYTTGGGGNNYERHVQAVFILSLLVDGFSPVINCPISKLHFQAKHLGYNTDDLVVISTNLSGERKVLCQIKSDIKITQSDKTFQEVMTAAWNDFIGGQFDAEFDRIALISSVVAKSSTRALIEIHEQAVQSESAGEFLQRIGQSNFINNDTRIKFGILKHCLCKAKGSELSAEELYSFCRVFVLVIFDGNYEGSVHEALCQSLIQCKSDSDPREAWSLLTEYAGQCNQSAASITRDRMAFYIKELFGFKNESSAQSRMLPSESLAQIVLVGAWNENNGEDRKAIESIVGKPYSEFRAFARELLNTGNQYISLADGIWRVSYRKELFPLVKDYLFDDTIRNAFEIAAQITAETSKRFESEDAINYFVPAEGWFSNSNSFRKSLCEGLCLVVNNDPPKNSAVRLVEQQAFLLVRNLFEQCSWKTLASLGDLTSILAELSPKAFLQELETFSVTKENELLKLFPSKKKNELWADNYMTQILWSLETLAWIPDLFGYCVRCLGVLELSGYEKTNHANIPLNSLVTILNAFRPQTYASVQQMKNAILALQKDSQDLCWAVIKALLPPSSLMMVETPKPRFIDLTAFDHKFSKSESNELLRYYIDTAIRLSFGSSYRMAELSKHVRNMNDDMASNYLKNIISASEYWTDEMKYPVWDSLIEWRVRIIIDNEHNEPDSTLFQLLNQAINASTPSEKWYRYLHLYTQRLDEYDLHECFEDDTAYGRKGREAAKSNAVFDLYNSFGIDKVISFGEKVKNPLDVGEKLGAQLHASQIAVILNQYSTNVDSQFFQSVIHAFIVANGVQILYELGLENYSESFCVKILCSAPFCPDTFSLLDHFLSDKAEYWKNVSALWFSPLWKKETIEVVINGLASVGRFDAIVNSIGHYIEKISITKELLLSIMFNAASENALDRIDQYAACRIISHLQTKAIPNIDNIDMLAAVEYAFLPFMTESSATRPKALYYKLSNDSVFFCELMELSYKPHNAKAPNHEISDGARQRLYELIFNFRVVPGVDWNGEFHPKRFQSWLLSALNWAEETDRLAVVQLTIGNGLSYAKTVNGLPDDVIMEVLNDPKNIDIRKGYQIGILNQRGAHWVDPEAKPELALAKIYDDYANEVEKRGFSRFAETLKDISAFYTSEAERVKKESAMDNNDDVW